MTPMPPLNFRSLSALAGNAQVNAASDNAAAMAAFMARTSSRVRVGLHRANSCACALFRRAEQAVASRSSPAFGGEKDVEGSRWRRLSRFLLHRGYRTARKPAGESERAEPQKTDDAAAATATAAFVAPGWRASLVVLSDQRR